MIKLSRIILLIISCACAFSAVSAENPAASSAQLKSGDIQHFIKTMPNMIKELEKLGAQYGDIQDPGSAQALMANDKVQAVLAKFKWDDSSFFQKLSAISSGFARVRMEQEMAKAPAAQREMMKSMMGAQLGEIYSVHDLDLAEVRKHMAALNKFFAEQ